MDFLPSPLLTLLLRRFSDVQSFSSYIFCVLMTIVRHKRIKERLVDDVVEKTSVPDIPTEQVSTAQPVVVQSFEEFGERDRSPSPSRHPVTCFIHIANLVRPFTANNLKRLISRTCEIVENGFWMNNIKSNCYIQVGSLEQATETREALHGLKWPSGTPKTLEVEFVTNGRIYQETDGAIGKKEKVLIEIGEDEDTTAVHEQKKEIKKRPERRPSDHRRSREKKVEKRKPEAEKEESPAKLLDDLFRKTKATPCIYWLPLTDEQILEKENKRNNEPQRNESHRENRQTYRDRSSRPRYSPNRRQAHMSSGRSWR